MSWRYRYAWMSVRARAARHQASVAQLVAAVDRLSTRLHLSEVGRAEDLDRLIAAGRTIRELEAALALAVKGNPS